MTGALLSPRLGATAVCLLISILGLGILVGGSAAESELSQRLAKGKLLVADRQLTQPEFSESVVLLIDYGPTGALGVIINRPTDIRLNTLLPRAKALRKRKDTVFFGGPVNVGGLLMLVRTDRPPEGASTVFGRVHASGSLKTLRRVISSNTPENRFRAYVGYAGWGAGQLDREVARGDWHIVPASEDIVFAASPAKVWEELIEKSSGQWVRLAPEFASGSGPPL